MSYRFMNKRFRRIYYTLFPACFLSLFTLVASAQNLNKDACLSVVDTSKENANKFVLLSNRNTVFPLTALPDGYRNENRQLPDNVSS